MKQTNERIEKKGTVLVELNRDRVSNLIHYVQGIMNQEDGKELYHKYRNDIEQVTPQEAFEIFNTMLDNGSEPAEILVFLDKIINVFYKSLSNYSWVWPEKNSFLDYLIQENKALVEKLKVIKTVIKDKQLPNKREELAAKIKELQLFDSHYLKKENILFPYLEKKMNRFAGITIMWALHDETRARLKKTIECLEFQGSSEAEINAALGKLFFAMHGLVQKEELILFPAATEVITSDEWIEMMQQSHEYDFPFIDKPDMEMAATDLHRTKEEVLSDYAKDCCFRTETGVLSFEDIYMIFNALPVDMTFVDENDKVKFFTRPKDRIFPRSPAIIGRDVQKCHPPQSLHVVNEILDSFREGKENSTTFWIQLKEKKILIQYFALRNAEGEYRGTLEVSQDITGIVKLEGERRLLHFNKPE